MPAETHPDRAELGRFVAGDLASLENRRVVRHLLSGCRRCRQATAELWRPSRVENLDGVVERALRRTVGRETAIERERGAADALAAELDQQSPNRRFLLILNSRRYLNWFLCERLIDKAFESGPSDPEAAVGEAEVAVALAERLLAIKGDEPVNLDLVGRSWAVLGNARRIQSDLAGADEALARASERLEGGSGDPVEESLVERFLGSLRRDQRRFDEAVGCFNRALRLARAAGDDHLAGRVLLAKATALGESGRPEEEIAALRQALASLDGEREPRLVLAARHNLTLALKDSGRLDEALSNLQEILPLHARSGRSMDRLRLRWLEGKLAQAQGELERAEAAFREVCDGFLDRRIPYDAALASLDLAAVLYEQDRLDEMQRLTAEVLPVFNTLGIHREALAALAMFGRAVAKERVTLSLIAELATYLQRARTEPGLAFEPPRSTPAP